MQRFWATDGHRKCTVFLFYLSSHYHIYIFKSLCASTDDYFENLGETNVLACKMCTSGCRPWLKNVACLSSLLKSWERTPITHLPTATLSIEQSNRSPGFSEFSTDYNYHLTRKTASAQVVEKSVTNNRPSQNSTHLDDLFQLTFSVEYISIDV